MAGWLTGTSRKTFKLRTGDNEYEVPDTTHDNDTWHRGKSSDLAVVCESHAEQPVEPTDNLYDRTIPLVTGLAFEMNPDPMSKCRHCGSKCNEDLAKHDETYHPNRILISACPHTDCLAGFTDKSQFKAHLAGPHQTARVCCEECGQAFHTRNDLEQHKTVHDDELLGDEPPTNNASHEGGPGQALITPTTLEDDELFGVEPENPSQTVGIDEAILQTGPSNAAEPFSRCDGCGKAYQGVVKHKNACRGRKRAAAPFHRCDGCGKEFRNLVKHRNARRGRGQRPEQKCPHCHKMIRQLEQHVSEFHSNKCSYKSNTKDRCNKTFDTAEAVSEHMGRDHNMCTCSTSYKDQHPAWEYHHRPQP